MGKKIIAYHGSPNDFNRFESTYMGTTGTADGQGFYFTTAKQIAMMYTNEQQGYVYTCELDIKGLLSNEKILISRAKLIKIITHLDKITDGLFLSDYGDVSFEGYNNVLMECINSLLEYNNSDIEIFGDCVNSSGTFDDTAAAFIKYGYNSLINEDPALGSSSNIDHQVIVMINADDIKILKKENLSAPTHESYRAKHVADVMLKG